MEAVIYNHKIWLKETKPDTLFEKLNNLLYTSGYTVIGHLDKHFEPYGYTCVWLLAESHLAVHTFPENNKTYIELSGCNQEMNEIFINDLSNWIETNK